MRSCSPSRRASWQRPRTLEPGVSPHLEAAILRAMAIDPRARFQTAGELDEALDEDDRTRERSAADAARAGWAARRTDGAAGGGGAGDGVGRLAVAHAHGRDAAAGAHLARASRRRRQYRGGHHRARRRGHGGPDDAAAGPRPRRGRARAGGGRGACARRSGRGAHDDGAHVVVDPPAARLTIDGARVAGPELRLQRDGARHLLRAEADGFAAAEAPFLAAGDQTLTLALKKAHKRPRGPADLIKVHGDDEGLDPKQLERLQQLMQQLGNDANGALTP